MNIIKHLVAASATTALLVSASAATAQSVKTDPVGFTTLTVNAKPADKRGFTLLSLNMTRPAVFQGLIPAGGVSASGSPTTLTFPAGTFTAGQFAVAPNGASHYLEIVNGANAGLISDIQSATTTSVTLADDVTAAVTAGTTIVRIRPLWTLATAFGANNSAGFQGGFSSSQADVIQVLDPATGLSSLYFYSTGNSRWQTGANDATNYIIPPDAGLRIERRANTPVAFTLTGAVKLGPSALFVQGGNAASVNYTPNPYPLNSVTLGTSNLFTGNSTTGVIGGFTASQSDTVSFYDTASGISTSYFYHTGNAQWQTGSTPANDVVIPSGTAIVIKRKAGASSFNWFVPQPTMNL
jgi:uncharacterized protein (TIGR02597 family)